VLGLAPSATAAHELSAALGIPCENTAKWLHETTGPGGRRRAAVLDGLAQRRTAAAVRDDMPAVRRIDAARAALQREHQRWSLRAGQLLVVDEASLAGTLALDALREQTVHAGAKVLLVGDHHQLSSVDAGGAFRLLAEHGTGVELRSLWRFRHRWEAWATRRLRHGDPEVVGEYETHGRIQNGPAEAMLQAAYRGWQDSERAGHAAGLVAAQTHTVEALNTRAHEDRVAAGLVATDSIPLGAHGERGQVGVGDRVVTRLNQRRLTVPGHGHVRNGSLWTVVATHADGSLAVSPADRHISHGCQPDPACLVTLPAARCSRNCPRSAPHGSRRTP
jgi:AAA domain